MTMAYPPNFSPNEFKCKCSGEFCDGSLPDEAATRHLAWSLQAIRNRAGVPLKITSGHRCPDYNAKVGGATNSQHKIGIAADLKPRGISPARLAQIIEELASGREIPEGGMGVYQTFVHYDIRPGKARWHG